MLLGQFRSVGQGGLDLLDGIEDHRRVDGHIGREDQIAAGDGEIRIVHLVLELV